ncbi:LOW QUALITY PROTEIN: cellobiose phosphorylase [Thermoanaerobacter siderophilus SR4]|uniref:Cellobiose phosphorylase n=1 Tax=Thermoanaerobacter siderophilus SR4 TaxID=880478 RepID=I9KRX5_9THEO|nr:LOW QUALITY PROTEIN: cellobiose phosphorylase [Thermoanaerobacter siderophilus SR4]
MEYVLIGAILLLIAAFVVHISKKPTWGKEDSIGDFDDIILSSEEMEKHAAEIAQNHNIMKRTKLSYLLIPWMNKNYNYIKNVYRNLNSILKEEDVYISQEEEWLLDNFYIIEEQVKEIRKSLSKSYYSGLPGLKNGLFKGYPRIYAIAFELVLHTDGKIDEKAIINFIKAYQTKALLSSSELWALSLMIRIALVEKIKRFARKLVETRHQREKAEKILTLLLEKEMKYEEVEKLIRNNINVADRFPLQFIEHLVSRLRKEGSNSVNVIQSIEKILMEYDTSINDVAEKAHQIQAKRQISIGNAITSLKTVSSLDWAQIFESLSSVEQVLRQDPDGTYPKMDFESRDYYRHEIEKIAKYYNTSETYVAKKAIECAKEVTEQEGKLGYINHVGFYLVGKGRSILENKLSNKSKRTISWGKIAKKSPETLYVGLILIFLLVEEFFALKYIAYFSNKWGLLFISGVILLIPFSEMSVQLVNWILVHIFKPVVLPKIELKEGIPEDAKTMVVISSLLPDEKRTKELIENLEVYYHANREKNLYFGLLGDFKDAPFEVMSEDEKIVKCALEQIEKLNEKYSKNGEKIFYYFHRKRKYNQMQKSWMGWERKRGALVEFNELLRGKEDTSFYVVSGDVAKLNIKYVITLDADTNLPIDTAKKLVGTMLHPLNKAVIDRDYGVVVEGYGLLQPRIGIDIESANATLFSKIYAGEGGIDPYTTAVSDVYQDLFGEGIYTGKGIYDVDVFRELLRDTIPDNSILSHDLLEGSFVRTGLVSDIELIDGYPAKYNSYTMRLHRWVRGDWQLLPYLKSKIKNRKGEMVKNPLSLITKWKIMDNLRRSVVSVALMLMLFLGFSLLPGSSFLWLGVAILTVFFPILPALVDTIFKGQFRHYWEKRHKAVITSIEAAFYQSLLNFVFLPYQAYMMADAIVRTLTRLYITRKNLLEWVTAADMEKRLRNDFASFFKRMWIVLVEGLALVALVMYFKPQDLIGAIVLFFLWAISPYIAFYISQPIISKEKTVSQEEMEELRLITRKTWRFFEDFVTESQNYLPPDNFQEDPPNGIAERTSPTNIGLYLVSVVGARDLGYITTTEMVERIKKTITTIEKMEKWNGHLYNWYNTRTLEPLRPYYVSTVDSGNLVGYLITVKEAIGEFLNKPLIDIELAKGLKDTIKMLDIEGITEDIFRNILNKKTLMPSDWEVFLSKIREKLSSTEDEVGNIERLKNIIGALKREMKEFLAWTEFDERQKEQEIFKRYKEVFEEHSSPKELEKVYKNYLLEIEEVFEKATEEEKALLKSQKDKVAQALEKIKKLEAEIENIKSTIENLVEKTEFRHLYDEKRQLFSIGYNVEEEKLTKSYYDLLASEARQASFIAIAKREIDKKHWFKLGRMLAIENRYKGLVSWSGTMFEYFMPLLIMKNYQNTLLDETYAFAVRVQKNYAKELGIPWGISESGFYAFDINLNYQYKAFGVPSLGLKRGLSHDKVVAPYGSLLAIGVDVEGVLQNIRFLKKEGVEGKYGFYEAIDYTPERVPFGKKSAIVKSFMAHHQGMAFVALDNFINNNIMQKRFHKDPSIKATQILLQEKMPMYLDITREEREEARKIQKVRKEDGDFVRVLGESKTWLPEVHILSSGRYFVMLTEKGTGYSKNNKGIFLTRWRKDLAQDFGTFIFVQNINSNTVWSATYAPFYEKGQNYRVVFSADKAEYFKRVGNIDTHLEIVVSPEDDVEIRRLTLKNHSKHPRILEITSFGEISLIDLPTDVAHPAFNKLFVKTEFLKEEDAILVCRKPREQGKNKLWAVHKVAVLSGEIVGDTQFETDRAKFIGRGRSLKNPIALEADQPLSNTEGAVLDPVVSLRKRVKVMPGEVAKVVYISAITETKEEAIKIAAKYKEENVVERAFEVSWTRSRVELDYLNLKPRELGLLQRMLAHILFVSPQRRYREEMILKNVKGQSGLWAYGISGDLPIVLVEIEKMEEIEMVKWFLKAYEYWKMKGINIDLVILNKDKSGYLQPLHDKIKELINTTFSYDIFGKYGGVYLLQQNNLKEEDVYLLNTVVALKFEGGNESIYDQIMIKETKNAPKLKNRVKKVQNFEEIKLEELPLDCYNGFGGFSYDGKEYIIKWEGKSTPAPWINVISNPSFGFQVSETGAGYTWAENSREYKLTPWYNDPVLDPHGEVIYLTDEETGDRWSITPLPAGKAKVHYIKHGFGYTSFETICCGLSQHLKMFVAKEDSIKINLVTIKNLGNENRKLTVSYYIRPVLGVTDEITFPYLFTKYDEKIGALMIKNVYNEDFANRLAFLSASEKINSFTGDRAEFIGVASSLTLPQALEYETLSNSTGISLDPCAAIQFHVEVKAKEEKQFTILLGHGKNEEEVKRLILKYTNVENCQNELRRVQEFWQELLRRIQIKTPDKSMDLLVNGWLPYQTIACRLWARSAFYQSGGAYGFRDQLQDAMNMVYLEPEFTKNQIVNACQHQFVEGDVQHWWHPVLNKGIRTKFADDLLWLPYVTADYIEKTGDWSILDIEVNYLEDLPLKEEEEERYSTPRISETKGTVYEHCIRAIDYSLKFGEHGLPLMGAGDWNDGMNKVGNKGKGESVWLGWFLYTILQKFSPICQTKKDEEHAKKYQEIANKLIKAIEENAWDGSWYRRAYFDDGTPLGSVDNSECKIDSISQSWSVISKAGKEVRVKEAMKAVVNYLVNEEEGIIKLLTPPFDSGELNPGYIKGYVPGVRENGGQYTHAAAWVILAFAELGEGDRAWQLYNMINPINHTRTPIECMKYKVEPYVIAADVYAVEPHVGRGGWTWYTGAAGWMYRIAIENLLGLKKYGEKLIIDPCIPKNWDKYVIEYNYKNTKYLIDVRNPNGVNKGVKEVYIDGELVTDKTIDLTKKGNSHQVLVVMG